MLKKFESWAVPFSIQRPWWWWRLAFWVIQVSECHCKGHFNHKSWCWSWNCSTKEYTSKNQKPKQKPRKKRQKQANKQTKPPKKTPQSLIRWDTLQIIRGLQLIFHERINFMCSKACDTHFVTIIAREREIFMISKVLMVFFKWMSSIWITCMIYGLFSDINTIDTLNYEYQLRTFWKTHAYDTLRLIMGLYNFWGVHAREKLHKHYKATKLLERHTISRSGWQKGNRWMKTKQQTPSWVRGKGMYIWGAMIRVESAPNVIKGLS